ncbi:MAG TPA: hypothetical protein DEQ38_02100 [Elusimicrobia bacterium]|nr:MAG: hypothetical protein A2089_07365 [Elusimicrobia bacterium GWD2_63_28]HCC46901.1 hypothetical protein [Elusimicrobiota bacterium]
MMKSKLFGSVLAKIRRERGFTSAHSFYKGVGGPKGLAMAFVSYWDMERGKKLPKSSRLKVILSALGLKPHSPEAKELVTAYFTALSGSDELLRIVAEPAAAAAPAMDMAQMAARRTIAQLGVTLTIAQWKVLAGDMAVHLCQSCLENTGGWLTVEELSAGLSLRPEQVRRALKALARCRLIELAGGRARCGYAGKIVQPLPPAPGTLPLRAALRAHWGNWHAKSEPLEGGRRVVRLGKAALSQYLRILRNAVEAASVYGNAAEDRKDSAVYVVDAGIARLFPGE